MSRNWYVEHNGRTVGPMNSDQLKKLVASGKIVPDTRLRLGGDGEWMNASKVKGLFPSPEVIVALKPWPPEPPSQIITAQTTEARYLPAAQTECPFCAELIAENAKKCKHCGEFLDPVLRAAAESRQPQAPAQIFMNVAGGSANATSTATAEAASRAYDWLDMPHFGSGTNPLPAMLFVIQLRPERIVLLSDGEFDPTFGDAITQANRSNQKPTKIDCVGLMEDVEVLKQIAASNKGIYFQAN